MQIKVEIPSKEKLDTMGVFDWPIWTCEKSVFDWEYSDNETCFLLSGDVIVTTEKGEIAKFQKGDMVTFPKGLKCKWEVREPVKKHYSFG